MLLILALLIFEWDPTSNAVWAVFGDRDHRLAFLVRQGQLQGVQELLERLRQNAQMGGRKGRVIEIIMLQALANQAQRQTMHALMLILLLILFEARFHGKAVNCIAARGAR